MRTEVTRAFKDKYGLDIEWTAAKSAEIYPKVVAERNAGLYVPDFVIGAISGSLSIFKPGGMLDPIKPLLVLPEVVDGTRWVSGDIPWVDHEKMYAINSLLSPAYKIVINTDMVRPDEITSYNDLLAPRWKGKIVLANVVLQTSIFTQVKILLGADWWTKFVANSPVIVDDDRQGMEWLSQGKYPVMLIGRVDVFEVFARAGAPVGRVVPKESTFMSGGSMSAVLMNRAPHPNAARVFANWLLTREGSHVLSRVTGVQSARLDVPTDHLAAASIRDTSARYLITESEDFMLQMVKDRDLAREIFGADGRGKR
ncbi:MAG: extracellular solute-binding protein [Chloroflexi bacterium]|nr:extracellular solute-binding protein [Chloroflexota bacterium]